MSGLFHLFLSRYKCGSGGYHCPNHSTGPTGCGGAHSNRGCDGEATEKQRLSISPNEVQWTGKWRRGLNNCSYPPITASSHSILTPVHATWLCISFMHIVTYIVCTDCCCDCNDKAVAYTGNKIKIITFGDYTRRHGCGRALLCDWILRCVCAHTAR